MHADTRTGTTDNSGADVGTGDAGAIDTAREVS